ncbi:MAG: GNAT family N-acetyltransferase, partial [Chitinophagaceae bacterium]
MNNLVIRTIEPKDDVAIANVIRTTLVEFNANHPGTVYFDASTDHLSELFQIAGSVYYVAVQEDEVVGGVGIFPTAGLPDQTCELVKMYLNTRVRGKGLGRILIEKALEFARNEGYKQVYIETMPELAKAMSVYEKFGFEYLDQQLGNTGHFGCEIWMLKK